MPKKKWSSAEDFRQQYVEAKRREGLIGDTKGVENLMKAMEAAAKSVDKFGYYFPDGSQFNHKTGAATPAQCKAKANLARGRL